MLAKWHLNRYKQNIHHPSNTPLPDFPAKPKDKFQNISEYSVFILFSFSCYVKLMTRSWRNSRSLCMCKIIYADATNKFAPRACNLIERIRKWASWHRDMMNVFIVGHYKELSTQRPGSPKNTTQHHDVSVQSTLDRRPMYYSQKMDPSSPNANSIMWTHTSLEIKFKIK